MPLCTARDQPLQQAATSPPLASSLSMPTGAHTSPSAAPARPEEGKEGWWSQMDAGKLNTDEAHADRKAPQAFTPQFVGNSGLVNRLVPLGSA